MKFIHKHKINEWVDTEEVKDTILDPTDNDLINDVRETALESYKHMITKKFDIGFFKYYASELAQKYGFSSYNIPDTINISLNSEGDIIKINIYAIYHEVYLGWFHTEQNLNVNRFTFKLTDDNWNEYICDERILLGKICKELNLKPNKFNLRIYFMFEDIKLSQLSYNSAIFVDIKEKRTIVSFTEIEYILNSLIFPIDKKPNTLILCGHSVLDRARITDFLVARNLKYKFSNIAFLYCDVRDDNLFNGINNILNVNAEYINIFFGNCNSMSSANLKDLIKHLNKDKNISIYLDGSTTAVLNQIENIKEYNSLKLWDTNKLSDIELNKWYHTHNIIH